MKRNIGSFMVAVGAVIEFEPTGEILVMHRGDHEVNQGLYELMYGRIGHHEELEVALKREIKEETGITDVNVKKLLRVWHIYRGEKTEDTEVYGFTFWVTTSSKKFTLSDEHTDAKWVKPDIARSMITVEGIRKDVENYIDYRQEVKGVAIAELNMNTKYL